MAKIGKSSTLILEAEQPVPFQLAFQTTEGGRRVSRHAKLTSPMLDPLMRSRKGTDVYFKSIENWKPGPRFALDPFEMASLAAYLQEQAEIRRELERELDRLLADWDRKKEIGRGPDIWKRTKIDGVMFWPRNVASAEQARFLERKFGRKAKTLLEVEFDAPDAVSGFDVAMTPAWAEHLLTAKFRDGRCVELQVEG